MSHSSTVPVTRRRLLQVGGLGLAGLAVPGATEWHQGARAEAAPPCLLVDDGLPLATIVLGSNADDNTRLAAKELVDHVQLMTGVKLPIGGQGKVQIRLDKAAQLTFREGFDVAGFTHRITRDRIDIAGPTSEGTLNGVYKLLEQLGVRWLLPEPHGTHAPQLTRLGLKSGTRSVEPAFEYRICGPYHEYYANPVPPNANLKEAAPFARRHGMNPHSRDLGGHNIPMLPPADKEKEPELFVLENGVRTAQLDVTNPEVQKRCIAACRQWMAEHPDAEYISMGPEDGLGFGHSEWDADDFDALAGLNSVTDRYIRFFNIVLDDLQRDWPELGICMFAYINYMRPPVNVKPNPKILPMFAPITVDRIHTIADDAGWERRYVLRLMEQWEAMGVEWATYSYLYVLADPGVPWSPLPQVRDEFTRFHEMGGRRGLRTEPSPSWGYDGPGVYAWQMFQWSPKTPIDDWLDDFYPKTYGPAARAARKHFERLEEVYATSPWTTGASHDLPRILTPEVLDELEASLREAEAAAERGSEGDRLHVHLMRLQFDFGKAFLGAIRAWRASQFATADQLLKQAKKVADEARNSNPVALYPWRVEMIDWFWTTPIEQGHDRSSGDKTVLVELDSTWQTILDNTGRAETDGVHLPGVKAHWRDLSALETWSNQGLRYFLPGKTLQRTTVTVPASAAGKVLTLWLGMVDTSARLWVDGHPAKAVQTNGGLSPWEFDLTGLVTPGKESVLVLEAERKWLNEVGTGGLMGPAFVWTDGTAIVDSDREPQAPGKLPEATVSDLEKTWAEVDALAKRPVPAGAHALSSDWYAVVDPGGVAAETGLYEARVPLNHFLEVSTRTGLARQGFQAYEGGMVYRQDVERGRPSARQLEIGAACGDVRVWVDGVECEVLEQGGLDAVTRIRLPKGLKRGSTLVVQVARPSKPVPGVAGLVGEVWVR